MFSIKLIVLNTEILIELAIRTTELDNSMFNIHLNNSLIMMHNVEIFIKVSTSRAELKVVKIKL